MKHFKTLEEAVEDYRRETAPLPSRSEIAEVKGFIQSLKSRLSKIYEHIGPEIRVVGSTAKETFVKGTYDVDIYIITKQYQEAYDLARDTFPHGKRKMGQLLIWYFRENGYDVDLVFVSPDFPKRDTLDHTTFFNKHLTPQMKNEVIKAKAFFKTAGVYSAEVGGITGVCIEELVRQHKTLDSVLKYLANCKSKPFIQDPVMKKPRNLLASVVPKRWRQLQNVCKNYLKTGRVEYRVFDETSFRKRYRTYTILTFPRKLDQATDFSTAQSIAMHSANMLRNLEGDVKFDSDVFISSTKILIALTATPKKLEKTKLVGIHKKFGEAVETFKKAHPNAFEKGSYVYARVDRKFTDPLLAYIKTVEQGMKSSGKTSSTFYGEKVD